MAQPNYPRPPLGYNDGGIAIKTENKGEFTRRANAAGMSTQAFANKVMNSPEGRYSPVVRKQANFARNASKWHRNEGGGIPPVPQMNPAPPAPRQQQSQHASAQQFQNSPELQAKLKQGIQRVMAGKMSLQELVEGMMKYGMPDAQIKQIIMEIQARMSQQGQPVQ